MKYIYETLKGSQRITENSALHGMIVGETSVDSNVTLNVHGTIVGNLILSEKSKVILHGMINGDIINAGELEIFGTVNGNLFKRDGKITIHPGAKINGNPNAS